jgi:TatD DNase family protein
MRLLDSHAHLDSRKFDSDRQQVVERAGARGVQIIVNPGADLPSSRQSVALAARKWAGVEIYAAVGVHPHDAKTLDAETLAELRTLAQSRPRVVAIGEIGLDYYRDLSPRVEQRRAFESQLALAKELCLPVIVHNRQAQDDLLAILRSWLRGGGAGPGGVLHSFSGDVAMAEEALDLGFYLGIGGPVTYKNARELPEVVKATPLERLLLETDCPYLPPHPHRGQRNEPAYVALVAEKVAQLQGRSVEDVAAVTTANARRLFVNLAHR